MTLLKKIKPPYHSIIDWSKRHLPYSYCIFISTLVLIICCFCLLLTNNNASKQILSAENHYGQQVAQMVANELSQATANNDLISMQAELNGLTKISTIDAATIYDLNNQAKVQAGIPTDKLDQQHTYLTFSAPISQDEIVIGQLAIKAKSTYTPSYSNAITAIGILCSLSLLLFCFYKIKIDIHKTETTPASKEDTPRINKDEEKKSTITLLLQLKNMDAVFQQLSKEIREEKFSEIKATIDQALKLYSGQLRAIDAHSLFMTICDHDKQQAIFNALCCAGLIQKMAAEEQWLIKINAVIYSVEEERKNNPSHYHSLAMLQYMKNDSKPGIFIDETLADSAKTRISTQTPNKKITGFVEVREFSDKYQKLLENQYKHLRNL